MNFSNFQIETIKNISKSPRFKEFVKIGGQTPLEMENPNRKRGPINILWYTKSDLVVLHKIGLKRVLEIRDSI